MESSSRIKTLAKTSSSISSSFRLRTSPSLNCLRLRRIFDLFDNNADGFITTDEISRALGLLGLDADLSELRSTVEAFVRPDHPGLTFDDFVLLHKSLDDAFFGLEAAASGEENITAQEESDLTEAFKVFDEDGDGFISAAELQAVLGKLGLPEGNEIVRVQRMITSVDRNCDGRVDFFEFKDMMRSVMVHTT